MSTRDEFEKWASWRSNLSQDSDGQYYSPLARASWNVWQARQKEIDALKAEIERLKLKDHIRDAKKMVLPPVVISCLRFYGNGEHFYIDPDGEGFDTVSGEPENWLCSQREGDSTMFENGGLARAVLRGELTETDPESQPVEGEVYGIDPDQLEHKLNMVPADNQDALDAARYRYLRDVSCEEEGDGALVVIFRGDWTISIEQAELCGEVLDATIDAQMQHTTEPEE